MPKPLSVKDVVTSYNKLKASSGGGAGYVKLESGTDVIVRLVTWVNEETDSEELSVEFTQNYLPQIKKSFIDPISFGGSKSPISKTVSYLDSSEQLPKETINRMKDRRRVAFLCIEGGSYKILEAPVTLATAIMGIFANEDYGNIADEKTGREIKIKKTGTGLDTEYEAHPRPERKAVPKNVEGKRPDLYTYLAGKCSTEQEMIDIVESTFKIDYEADVLSGLQQEHEKRVEEKEWETDYVPKELKGKTRTQLLNIAKGVAKANGEKVDPKWTDDQLRSFITDGVPF